MARAAGSVASGNVRLLRTGQQGRPRRVAVATPRAVARGSAPEWSSSSGEWPASIHLASYEDVQEFFRKPAKSPAIIKPRKQRDVARYAIAGPPPSEWPSTISQDMYESVVQGIEKRLKASIDPQRKLKTLMTDLKYIAKKEDMVSNIVQAFDFVTGVVVIENFEIVGVLSKKDINDENVRHNAFGLPCVSVWRCTLCLNFLLGCSCSTFAERNFFFVVVLL